MDPWTILDRKHFAVHMQLTVDALRKREIAETEDQFLYQRAFADKYRGSCSPRYYYWQVVLWELYRQGKMCLEQCRVQRETLLGDPIMKKRLACAFEMPKELNVSRGRVAG